MTFMRVNLLNIVRRKKPTPSTWWVQENERPSEIEIFPPDFTLAQLAKIDAAPSSCAVEENCVNDVNPDRWTEDEEHVLLLNGYPYQNRFEESTRIHYLRAVGKRIKESREERKRLAGVVGIREGKIAESPED